MGESTPTGDVPQSAEPGLYLGYEHQEIIMAHELRSTRLRMKDAAPEPFQLRLEFFFTL